MGMEIVEIVVRVEDAFGINISDVEAAKLTTTQQIADFVATKVPVSDDPSCLTQQAFYFLREHFANHYSVTRESFHPRTQLDQFVPREYRRQTWAALRNEIGEHAIPDLARPIWLFWALVVLSIVVFVYATGYVSQSLNPYVGFVVGVLVTATFGYCSAMITRPTKQNFRRHLRNLAQVTNHLVAHQPHVFKKASRSWTRQQILAVIHTIVAEESDLKEFSDDARFVEDLHLG